MMFFDIRDGWLSRDQQELSFIEIGIKGTHELHKTICTLKAAQVLFLVVIEIAMLLFPSVEDIE